MTRSLLGLFLLVENGCFATRMYYASEVPSGAVRSATTHSLLWGLVPVGRVNVEDLCGEAAVSELKTSVSMLGVLVGTVTMGAWTPMRVTATCSAR